MTTPDIPLGEIDQSSYGKRLIAAREARQLSVEDVAAQLNLHHSVISALEQERHDQLPTPAFVRGYLRSYARLLGIDGDELVREYGSSGMQDPLPGAMVGNEVVQPRSSHPLMRWATLGIVALLIALLVAWLLTRDGGALFSGEPSTDQSAEAPLVRSAGDGDEAAPSAATDESLALVDPLPEPAATPDDERASAGTAAGGPGGESGLPQVIPTGEPGAEDSGGIAGAAGEGGAGDDSGAGAAALSAAANGVAEAVSDAISDAEEVAGLGTDQIARGEARSADSADSGDGGDGGDGGDAVAEPASADAASTARRAAAAAGFDADADSEPLQPVPAASDGTDILELRSVEDSWTEITDSEGERLMFDLLRGEEPRRLIGVAPFEVFLGNAPTVELKVNGIAVAPPRISSRNTARFQVGADGALQ